jgi:hypothetical protein
MRLVREWPKTRISRSSVNHAPDPFVAGRKLCLLISGRSRRELWACSSCAVTTCSNWTGSWGCSPLEHHRIPQRRCSEDQLSLPAWPCIRCSPVGVRVPLFPTSPRALPSGPTNIPSGCVTTRMARTSSSAGREVSPHLRQARLSAEDRTNCGGGDGRFPPAASSRPKS